MPNEQKYALLDEKAAGEVGSGYTESEIRVLMTSWREWYGYDLVAIPLNNKES